MQLLMMMMMTMMTMLVVIITHMMKTLSFILMCWFWGIVLGLTLVTGVIVVLMVVVRILMMMIMLMARICVSICVPFLQIISVQWSCGFCSCLVDMKRCCLIPQGVVLITW